ncbi:energy-coupling factor transporter transmembrane component T family protein [Nocardiopsis suaedae]|uniref:Energy-coupling factor transporter transmembrane protein EcfT n=1 Tax=Nocardiopsis suaedae TaxID=3018444 RepID=A0ABT4TUI7_9ACTN|nr:energy-coupling factor transporter transmembrane protein EcfT [Nocardiopsis suaedae]MDA2808379.1 energy-coupling factor transporter transmembrane protein EcfT [Nocardiopsis suaedae]
MNTSLYVPGNTPLHRLPAGAKFGVLFAAGIGLFLLAHPGVLGAAAAVAAVLVLSARAPLAALRARLLPVGVMLAVLFAATALLQDVPAAVVMLLRLAALILLALAVTLTTRPADLLEFFERLTAPLARVGVADPERISLGVSLVLRFVPEVFRRFQEIREAQAARGLKANPVALLVPLIVRTLKAADDVADAIDARCYPPPRRPSGGARTEENPT